MARDDHCNDRLAKLRGRLTEQKFHFVMRQHDFDWPKWLWGVRPATYDEDLNGVDAYIETAKEGWIPVQIKSSFKGKEAHIAKYGRKHCIIVIPPRLGMGKTRKAIVRRLEEFIAMRRQGADR